MIHPKKNVCACARVLVCSSNLGFSGENTNLGFSVGYVLCATYVCTWYQPADHSMVPARYVRTIEGYVHPPPKKKHLVAASASLPIAGSALPLVGRATPLLW